MATSIFPTAAEGGVVVRTAGGVCLSPPGVLQAYCPPASFTSTGALRYYAEGCGSFLTPSWANAVMSEMVCLAAYWDPNGNWDFDSLCNLRNAFQGWASATIPSLTQPDPLTPLAGVAGLTAADRGLSLGEAQMPSGPATIAQMTAPNTDRVSVPVRDLQHIFTNRAAQPVARGYMNPDGRLGFGFRTFNVPVPDWVPQAQQLVDENNGLLLRVVLDTANATPTLPMPVPAYNGQVLALFVGTNDAAPPGLFAEARVSIAGLNVFGTLRRTTHEIGQVYQAITPNGFIVRPREMYLFVATSPGIWRVVGGFVRLFHGAGFAEQHDGTVVLWGDTAISGPSGTILGLNLAQPVTNPGTDLVVSAVRRSPVAAAAIGGVLGVADLASGCVFHHVPVADTGTQVALAWQGVGVAPVASGRVEWKVTNARLDYAAMGGIASFGP